ncbi:MAG: hypothetical protein ABXS92_06185 [Sulfurimonas sp.]
MKTLKILIAVFTVFFIIGCSDNTTSPTGGEETGIAWVANSQDVNYTEDSLVKVNLEDGNLTMIANYSGDANLSGVLLNGADMMGDRYITVGLFDSRLYSFNINGDYTIEADYSGTIGTGIITGIAYDSTNDKLYMTSVDTIWELDTSSFAIINTVTIESGFMIGVACSADVTMYGLDIASDQLVTIDTIDGNVTVVGSIGFDANYAQDIAYDRINDKLYGALYSDNGALYTIDMNSGNATKINNFSTSSVELSGFAITY